MDLQQLLLPLRPEHLGVLAVAYHIADGPGRAVAVRDLLHQQFGLRVQAETAQEVLNRLLQQQPHLIAFSRGPESSLQPRSRSADALWQTQFVPAHWIGKCIMDGGLLVRAGTRPISCFTLAFGLCSGEALLLRCVLCGAMFCGPWCWPTGGTEANFPAGWHHPKAATTRERLEQARWFFATPQVCYETALLRLCLLLAARGGVSWTAFFVVYTSLFGHTFASTQWARREHFVTHLEVAAPQLQNRPCFLLALELFLEGADQPRSWCGDPCG